MRRRARHAGTLACIGLCSLSDNLPSQRHRRCDGRRAPYLVGRQSVRRSWQCEFGRDETQVTIRTHAER